MFYLYRNFLWVSLQPITVIARVKHIFIKLDRPPNITGKTETKKKTTYMFNI